MVYSDKNNLELLYNTNTNTNIKIIVLYNILILSVYEYIMDNDNDNDKCVICLEDIKISNKSNFVYNCNHIYHNKCITKWNGSCPTCRSSRNNYNYNIVIDNTIYKCHIGMILEISYEDNTYIGEFTNLVNNDSDNNSYMVLSHTSHNSNIFTEFKITINNQKQNIKNIG